MNRQRHSVGGAHLGQRRSAGDGGGHMNRQRRSAGGEHMMSRRRTGPRSGALSRSMRTASGPHFAGRRRHHHRPAGRHRPASRASRRARVFGLQSHSRLRLEQTRRDWESMPSRTDRRTRREACTCRRCERRNAVSTTHALAPVLGVSALGRRNVDTLT